MLKSLLKEMEFKFVKEGLKNRSYRIKSEIKSRLIEKDENEEK